MNKKHSILGLVAASVLIVGAFFSTGCASTDGDGGEQIVSRDDLRSAVRIAVAVYGQEYPERITRARAVIADARQYVDADGAVTVDQIADRIRQEILWDQLPPAQAVAAEELLARIEARVKERIETGQLSARRLETVSQVLVWADDVLRRIEGDPAVGAEIMESASASAGPVDFSLWGYVTSQRTRDATRAHYRRQALSEDKKADIRALDALARATDPETGEVDHQVYRRITGAQTPDPADL